MKVIAVVVLALIATASALEWDQVKSLDINRIIPKMLLPKHDPNARIVNGKEAVPHSVPWQAGLLIQMKNVEGTAFCGGSIINNQWILTAAHCIEPATSVEVVLGAHKVKEEETTQIRMISNEFFHHERWSRFTLLNDIALVKLPKPIEFNENIQPIGLNTEPKVEGLKATVTGWGKDSDKATSVSDVLRTITVPVMSNEKCNKYFFGVIQDTHLCTDSWTGQVGAGQSTCNGDSGGPLVLDGKNQVGIVSFGIAFGCELGFPAAFTRVSSYIDWINEKTA